VKTVLFVTIIGYQSSFETILYGVPQGSNLEPILFFVYVNDMFNNFDTHPVIYK